MALFANGGPSGTNKPHVASGAYVKRMSNYCDGCRYRPDVRTGADVLSDDHALLALSDPA